MSRWWRAYDEAVDDPKLQRLAPALFKSWFNLCCITSQNGGALPPIDAVAFKLRTTAAKAAAAITELTVAGLIDKDGNGQFAPHNWHGRQFQSDGSTGRVKRFRKRQRNASSAVSETPPETESETDTEAEKKETRARGALASGWPPDYRDQFWNAYPHKIGKADAIRRLERVGKSGKVAFDTLMFALNAYANKTDDRPFCNPATWINQERWTDAPANGNGHAKPSDWRARNDDGHAALAELRDGIPSLAHGGGGQGGG